MCTVHVCAPILCCSLIAAQSFLNFALLCLTFTVTLACRHGDRSLFTCLRKHWWQYLLISVADVEANYLVVKAYSYTTVTSVQVKTLLLMFKKSHGILIYFLLGPCDWRWRSPIVITSFVCLSVCVSMLY